MTNFENMIEKIFDGNKSCIRSTDSTAHLKKEPTSKLYCYKYM